MAFFDRLLDFKKLGLVQKEESVVGLDIGSSSIKAVQVRKKGGKVVLETYGELSLGTYAGMAVGQATNLPIEKIVEAIKDLFREANITTKRASLSIPLKSSLLKVIQIPEFSEKELARVIPLEARKYIPVPVSEVELDWWVLPKEELTLDIPAEEISQEERKNKMEVLTVAIHKEVLGKYRSIVEQAGLETGTFEVETFSAIRAVLGREIAPVVLLDIGASTTKMTVIDYGIVRLSHTINKGAQDITMGLATALNIPFDEAERRKRRDGLHMEAGQAALGGVMSSVMEYIFYEANHVVADFQKKNGRIIRKIVLLGGGALLPGLNDLAKKSFESEVVLGDAFNKTQAPAFLSDVLRDAGPEFAISIGLALRELEERG